MKLSWRVEFPQLLIIAAMFAVAAFAWSQVPDRIPVHWNIHGDVDGWGSKFTGLLLMPIIVFGIYLLTLIVPLVDPGRGNYKNFGKAFAVIRIANVLFMALIYAIVVLAAFGHNVNMSTVVMLATGVLLIVIGNFMSKIRPNWFVGVRTPWTLSSKLSWNKTHHLAGWLFMLIGALFFVMVLAPNFWMMTAIFVFDALCLAWIIAYSYLVYRNDPYRTPPAGTAPNDEPSEAGPI
jgi:uncharacterized membrane protein